MNSSNAFIPGLEALEGLRPSFSAHVSWCEHGAPVEFCLVLRSSARASAAAGRRSCRFAHNQFGWQLDASSVLAFFVRDKERTHNGAT
jgi:hypothetical protein